MPAGRSPLFRHLRSLPEPVLALNRFLEASHLGSLVLTSQYEDSRREQQTSLHHTPVATSTGFASPKQAAAGPM